VLQRTGFSAASDVAGTGTLTLSVDGTSHDVVLAAPNNKLSDLATAINGSGAGVTASVVTDQNGTRLVLKGATGADQAFTLTAGVDADADLQRFTFNGTSGGLESKQPAQNAQISIDNVDMEFASNTITGAIPNLRIDLNRAAPGTAVTLATNQPTATLKDLVREYVTAYNALKTALNGAMASGTNGSESGVLSGDRGIRDMAQRLARLNSTQLSADGPYRTLSEIGVKTEKDGTLSLNSTRLDAVIAADPAAVTKLLNPTTPDAANPGIAGALKTVMDELNGANGPLATSKAIYDKLRDNLSKQLEKIDASKSTYQESLTRTYSSMQAQLLQFQRTQSYMDQQIKLWSGSGN
jgi:flagellar hook-associated protein 2